MADRRGQTADSAEFREKLPSRWQFHANLHFRPHDDRSSWAGGRQLNRDFRDESVFMQVEREVRAAIRADARCYEVVIGYGARARYGPNQRELSDHPTNRTTMSFRVPFLW